MYLPRAFFLKLHYCRNNFSLHALRNDFLSPCSIAVLISSTKVCHLKLEIASNRVLVIRRAFETVLFLDFNFLDRLL